VLHYYFRGKGNEKKGGREGELAGGFSLGKGENQWQEIENMGHLLTKRKRLQRRGNPPEISHNHGE